MALKEAWWQYSAPWVPAEAQLQSLDAQHGTGAVGHVGLLLLLGHGQLVLLVPLLF